MRDVFMHRATRLVHKDGCVRFQGALYEVPGDLVGERVELRYDPRVPEDRPLVWHRGVYSDVANLLDRVANASGKRKALPATAPAKGLEIDAIALLEADYYRTVYGAAGDGDGDGSDDGSDDDGDDGDDDDDDDDSDGGVL